MKSAMRGTRPVRRSGCALRSAGRRLQPHWASGGPARDPAWLLVVRGFRSYPLTSSVAPFSREFAPAQFEFVLTRVPSVPLLCRKGATSVSLNGENPKSPTRSISRLAHTQQDEVFFNAIRVERLRWHAEPSKRFDRMLGVVVVPRDWQQRTILSVNLRTSLARAESSLSGSHSSPHTRSCRGRPLA